jgi:outer membrane receptor for ferrienterochelin and colicins
MTATRFSTHRRPRWTHSALSLAALATLAGLNIAQAQESVVTLTPVVVSASGYEQKIPDAPASISVITQEDLSKRPYTTLLDAVRDLEGVDIGETRDKTGQGTISLRGMGSDYTLILVDGKRQNNNGDIYPNSFGGNQFGHIPPMDAIERIEVIRGPASTLYGADAMGGVINIITKKVTDKWQGSVTVGGTFQQDDTWGNDRTADFNIMGPIIPGKLGLSVRGSRYQRDASNPTYDATKDPNGDVVERSLGFGGGGKTVDNTNTAVGASLSWKPTHNQSLTLAIDTSRQEYDNKTKINDAGVEEYPVGTVDDYGSMLRIGTSGASNGRIEPRAGYRPSQEFTRDTWSLTHEGQWDFGTSFLSLAHVATNNNGRTLPYTVDERQALQNLWNTACASAGGTVNGSGYCPTAGTGFNNNWSEAQKLQFMDQYLSAAEYEELLSNLPRPKRVMESRQYTLDAKLDLPYDLAGEHLLVVGTQLVRGELEDSVFGMEDGSPNQVQRHHMWSVFAEDTWTVLDPLALTGGLRYDNHDVFGSHLSPRLYGVYTLNPQWTLKGGVSTGYKAPKTTDLYDGVVGFGGQGTSPMFGNPDLKPETSVSQELAVYWQGARGSNFNVTVFQNQFKDKISSQDCGAGTAYTCSSAGEYADLGYTSSSKKVNIDEVELNGVEVAGRWQIASTWSLRGNYTYTHSEQLSGDDKGLPLGNSPEHMLNATVDWRLLPQFNVFLVSENQFKRYRGQHVITDEKLYYKDYQVFHLGASYQANKTFTLNARINNLLDKDFTTYKTEFRDLNNDGDYADTNVGGQGRNETLYFDDYNNKDKGRSFWVSLNARF